MHYAQFRAFHAVATCGGFSKAAAHLGLTQPAISDQVRKIEEHFGVSLFNRHKRAVTPTEVGYRLLEITNRFFELEKQAIELLSETQALKTGHLKITADAPFHILEIVGLFQARYPGITISLRRGNTETVMGQLRDFKADIGILGQVPKDDRLRVIDLRRDPLVAFVHHDHPWGKRKSASLKELAGEGLILREKGSSTRQMVEAEFVRLGLKPKIAIEVEGREAIREAVATGIGVGIVSQPEFGHDDRLRAIRITDFAGRMTESLVCLKEREEASLIAAFLECARENLGQAG